MNPSVKVLGISGKRLSGKDYFARMVIKLLESRGIKTMHIPIALTLKQIYAEMHGFNYLVLNDPQLKEKHRGGLIALGAERRRMNKDYWVSQVAGKIQMQRICAKPVPTVYLVTDMRYLNEFNYFEEAFGDEIFIPVRMLSSTETRRKRGWVYEERIDRDQSEIDLDDVPQSRFRLIENDGATAELEEKALRLVSDIMPDLISKHRGDNGKRE